MNAVQLREMLSRRNILPARIDLRKGDSLVVRHSEDISVAGDRIIVNHELGIQIVLPCERIVGVTSLNHRYGVVKRRR